MDDVLAFCLTVGASTLRLATPLILCAMGGLFSERSGVVDIALDGKMLIGAFAAAATATVTGSAWLGLAAACLASALVALLHGVVAILQGGHQVVSGVALNLLASGLTVVLGQAWFRQGGATPALPAEARFMPLAGGLGLPVYAALLSVPAAFVLLGRTRFGLRLRAAGEEPRAVDAAGLSVARLRFSAVAICGVLTGLAGASLSLAQNAGFAREMTAGQGYLALAAVIFGKWRPLPVFAACLLFGLIDALALRLQGLRLGGIGEIPVQFVQVLPYLLTLVLLAGLVGRATPPKALGLPFRRG